MAPREEERNVRTLILGVGSSILTDDSVGMVVADIKITDGALDEVNLAHAAAVAGTRTVLWDLDPQGATSFYLRALPSIPGGVQSILDPSHDLRALIHGSEFDNLSLLPAEIKELRLGLLKLSTDYMSTVYVQWDKVESIRTDKRWIMETQSGARYTGVLVPDEVAVVGVPAAAELAEMKRWPPEESESMAHALRARLERGAAAALGPLPAGRPLRPLRGGGALPVLPLPGRFVPDETDDVVPPGGKERRERGPDQA